MPLKDTEFYFEYPIRHGDFTVGTIEGKCEVMYDASLELVFFSFPTSDHTIPVTDQDGMLQKVTDFLNECHKADIHRCYDEAAEKARFYANQRTVHDAA